MKFGIATLSLGSFEHHTLAKKIEAASKCGYDEIELFDLDWFNYRDTYAIEHNLPKSTCEGDNTSIVAATALGELVKSYGMKISCFQPIRNFEGIIDPIARAEKRAFAQGILDICGPLGTSLVLCCSSCEPSPLANGSLAQCVDDFTWLSEQAAKFTPPIRIMYEGLSFASHRSSWQDAWEVIEAVNLPNLGLCLDSFNTLALEYSDPYAESGVLSPHVDSLLDKNMEDLVRRVPGDRIFFYQVADGKRMSPPMPPHTDPEVPKLRPWSRSYRLFPCEQDLGGYLPVDKFSDAVIRCGYVGPWSLEVFNSSLSDNDESVPLVHGMRGIKGLKKCFEESFARVNGESSAMSKL